MTNFINDSIFLPLFFSLRWKRMEMRSNKIDPKAKPNKTFFQNEKINYLTLSIVVQSNHLPEKESIFSIRFCVICFHLSLPLCDCFIGPYHVPLATVSVLTVQCYWKPEVCLIYQNKCLSWANGAHQISREYTSDNISASVQCTIIGDRNKNTLNLKANTAIITSFRIFTLLYTAILLKR